MFRNMIVAATMLASVPIAAADTAAPHWWYAESDHFRVYSSGGSAAATTMAVKLERLDQAMRIFTGVAADQEAVAEVSKPTIYQFGKTEDIGKLAGQDGVAGFFIPRAGNSVAFVPLEEGPKTKFSSSPGTRDSYQFYEYDIPPETVLFHEYAHYFMFQHAPGAYPAWYVEGLAELFGTLKLMDAGFALGDPPKHRMGEIGLIDVDTGKLFSSNAQSSRYIDYPLYGHGWLASSYLSFVPERSGQLATFLRAINKGTDAHTAAEAAFGDLKKLEKELNAYRKERARGIVAKFREPEEPAVAARALTGDEAARMEVMIESEKGVTKTRARRLSPDAVALAARYPTSVPVLLTATEATFDAQDLAEAEGYAHRVLNADPNSVQAHLYLARIAMERAKTDAKWLATAREQFLAANSIDPQEPNALAGYYTTFRLADETPPEDALIALESAYRFAPFDGRVRKLLAHLLLLEKRDDEALVVLGPVIYSAHAGRQERKLRALVDKLNAGDRAPLTEELRPKLSDDESDEA